MIKQVNNLKNKLLLLIYKKNLWVQPTKKSESEIWKPPFCYDDSFGLKLIITNINNRIAFRTKDI